MIDRLRRITQYMVHTYIIFLLVLIRVLELTYSFVHDLPLFPYHLHDDFLNAYPGACMSCLPTHFHIVFVLSPHKLYTYPCLP